MNSDVAPHLKSYFVVFVASACVLVLEIVAGRLLAPTIGVSLYTWTSIIGVVLAGISVGSFAGGMAADRFPSPTTLGLVLLAGGVSSLAVLPLVEVTSGAFSFLPVQIQIVLIVGSLFFVPSLILGMVTPVVIKLQLRDLADTGKLVGRIYALSAAGSIFGTFITGFVLIQWVGSRYTLILVAVTLAILALVFCDLWQKRSLSLGSLTIMLGLGAAGFATGALDSGCVRESNYYCIDVRDATLNDGREVKALYLDQLLHSYVALDDPTYLVYGYEKIFGEIATHVAQKEPNFRALFIGGGGYTLPRNLEELYPGSILEVIEIDPAVTNVAFDYLGLRPDTRIITYNEDARLKIPKLPEGKFDLVIGDAFNDVSVPYHLTTKEFNEQVSALMKDDGIYAINVIDKLHSGRFLRAFVNTLEKTFTHVAIIRDVPQWESDRQHTYVVVASFQTLSATDLQIAVALSGRGESISNFMPRTTMDAWMNDKEKILLTDDYAPVDNLMAPIFLASSRLSDAEQHYNSGAKFQSQGRFDEAINEYDEAIRLDPGDAFAFHNRGRSFSELEKFQAAIQDYTKAIQLAPNYREAFNDRGASFQKLGQTQRAIRDFDLAISLSPSHPDAYLNRGIAYAELGQHQQSLQDFGTAIRLEPGSALGYRNRGTSFLALGQFHQAVQNFDDAITLDHLDPATHNNRGTAHLNLGLFQKAIQDFDEAIFLDAEHASAFNNRGIANNNLGNFLLALQDFGEAIRLDPLYSRAYNNRGTAYRGLGQFNRGILDFDEAIRLNPRYATAYANRALNLTHLNQDSAARLDVERAVDAGFSRGLLVGEIEAIIAQR